MTQDSVKTIIINTLSEMGISIKLPDISNDSPDQDIDISEYIADSIMFISFVFELERQLEIEFPDELLSIDALSSLSGFTYLLTETINQGKEDQNESQTKIQAKEADSQC